MGDRIPVAGWSLQLIDRWVLSHNDCVVSVPRRGQRLVAFLALHPNVPRAVAAAALWPDSTESQARTNLRAVTGTLRKDAPGLLATNGEPLALADDVSVDLRDVLDSALSWGVGKDGESSPSLELLSVGELLPGWYEDWLSPERERLQQALVLALERLSNQLLSEGDPTGALQAITRCTEIQPLRESAHRQLVRVHLASGNRL